MVSATVNSMKMKTGPSRTWILPALLAGFALIGVGCGSGEKATIKTAETEGTKQAIENYQANSTDAAKAKVEKSFSELDQEIHELEVRVENTSGPARTEADTKLSELKQRRMELRADYTEAKFNALIEDVKNSVR